MALSHTFHAPVGDLTRENPYLQSLQLEKTVFAQNAEDAGQKSGLRNKLS